MKARLTNEERAWGLAQLPTLESFISDGKWEYSISKLKQEHGAYSFFTWTEVHPFLSVVLFLLFIPLGFIPAILYAILLMMMKPGREQYEVHLVKLKNGHFEKVSEKSPVASNTGELVKLHELLKAGALTQEEFETEKKKILGRVA